MEPSNSPTTTSPTSHNRNQSTMSNDSLVIHQEDHIDDPKSQELHTGPEDEQQEDSTTPQPPNFFHQLSLRFYGGEAQEGAELDDNGEAEGDISYESNKSTPSHQVDEDEAEGGEVAVPVRSLTELTTTVRPSMKSRGNSKKFAAKDFVNGVNVEAGGQKDGKMLDSKKHKSSISKGKGSRDMRDWGIGQVKDGQKPVNRPFCFTRKDLLIPLDSTTNIPMGTFTITSGRRMKMNRNVPK